MSNIELPNHSGLFNDYYIYIIIMYLCIIQGVENQGLFIQCQVSIWGTESTLKHFAH